MKNRFVLLALWGALLYNAPMMASGAPAPAAAQRSADELKALYDAAFAATDANHRKVNRLGAQTLRFLTKKKAAAEKAAAPLKAARTAGFPGSKRKKAAKAAYNALLAETPEYGTALETIGYADYVAPDQQALDAAKTSREWGYDASGAEITEDALLEASKQAWINAGKKDWESRSALQKAQALANAKQARIKNLYDNGAFNEDATMDDAGEFLVWGDRAAGKAPYFVGNPSARKFNMAGILADGKASLAAKAAKKAATTALRAQRAAEAVRQAELDARTMGRRFADHFTGDDFRDAKGQNGGFADNKLAMTGRYVDATGNVVVAVVGTKWLIKGENPIVDALYAKFKDAKKVGRIIGAIAGWFSKSKGRKRFATVLGMLGSSEFLGAFAKGRPTLVKGLASGTASLYRKVRGY